MPCHPSLMTSDRVWVPYTQLKWSIMMLDHPINLRWNVALFSYSPLSCSGCTGDMCLLTQTPGNHVVQAVELGRCQSCTRAH